MYCRGWSRSRRCIVAVVGGWWWWDVKAAREQDAKMEWRIEAGLLD